jgi:hypothetical protein
MHTSPDFRLSIQEHLELKPLPPAGERRYLLLGLTQLKDNLCLNKGLKPLVCEPNCVTSMLYNPSNEECQLQWSHNLLVLSPHGMEVVQD